MSKSSSRGRAASASVVGRVARSVLAEPLEERRLFASLTPVPATTPTPTPTPPNYTTTATVTNLDADGPGSLWQAVQDANAAAGLGLITFQAGLTGTITTPGQLLIRDDLALVGPGAEAITVTPRFDEQEGGVNSVVVVGDGDPLNPFTPSGALDVFISDLTFAGGSQDTGGGGIINQDEHLVLRRIVVRDCTTLGGSGGGIANYGGDLFLESSTVTGNSAGGSADAGGGGIYSSGGNLIVRFSTISGNTSGGGTSYGGGVFVKGGSADIISSTVSGNTQSGAGGGVAFEGDILNIFNATIADNRAAAGLAPAEDGGGGLYVIDGAAYVISSLFDGNQAQRTNDDPFFDSDIARAAGTLTGDALLLGSTPADGTFTAALTSSLIDVDAMIGDLADNGGPTQTHALLEGSPAIGAGQNNAATHQTDQRGNGIRNEGFARVKGGAIDIGAFESGTEVPNFSSVDPLPVVPSNAAQTFTINGVRFAREGATVRLTHKGSFDEVISFPTVTEVTAAQIKFRATIGSFEGVWTVEVINPDGGTSDPFVLLVRDTPAPVPTGPVTVGDGEARAVTFTDADGTLVTVTLKGGGTADLAFGGQGVQATPGRAGTTVTGTDLTLTSVALANTTGRSSLTIKTRGGDGRATLPALTGETPLGRLAAATTDLAGGAGITLGGTGTIGSVLLNDVADSAAIELPGTSAVTLRLGEVRAATITTGGALTSLAADALGGAVSAPSIGTIKVGGALSAEVRTPGSIRSVTAGTFSGARVFAGVRDDLTTLPTTTTDFANASASVGTVAVKSRSAGAFGAGSLIVAPTVGRLSLGTLDTAAGGEPFGIAADRARSVTATLPGGERLRLSRLESPDQTLTEADFTVRVL